MPSQEAEDVPEWEARDKIPVMIRPIFVGMPDILSVHKWYAHDQFKPENQAKEALAQGSKEAGDSKLHTTFKKYPDVESIKWSEDCPKEYVRGKLFLPNWVIRQLPNNMRRFHDWYLRIDPIELTIVQAFIPAGTFGAPEGTIAFDFDDMHTCFRLGSMEMNLVRTWCL